MKKKVATLLCAVLMIATLAGCGSSSANGEDSIKETGTEEKEEKESIKLESADVSEVLDGYQVNTELDQSEEITLDLVGPSIFSSEEETTDLVSGIVKPGYNKIVERWNELYPNVKLNFNLCPWNDWQAYITTACLDGNADIILHGASMTDLAEDLTPYLDKEPEYQEMLYATAKRRLSDSMDQLIVTGIPATNNPIIMWVDTEKFANFGVELPDDQWTVDELKAAAEKLTGMDPVTGEQTYGFLLAFSGTGNLYYNHWFLADVYDAQIYNYGATMKDSTVNYLSEGSIKAFQTIAELAQYESPEAKEGVAVPTGFDGTNDHAIIISNVPVSDYLLMKASGLEDKYAPYPLFTIEEGEDAGKPVANMGDNNLAIYKESDAKEWAWEFIKFMTTDTVAVQWLVDNLYYPNNVDAIESVKGVLGEKTVEVLNKALGAVPEDFSPAGNNMNTVSFGPVTTNLYTAVDDVVNGRMTPEEAAHFMQDSVDEYLSTVQ